MPADRLALHAHASWIPATNGGTGYVGSQVSIVNILHVQTNLEAVYNHRGVTASTPMAQAEQLFMVR
jgi:hypothetical protein